MGIFIHPESHNLYNLVPFICTTQTGQNRKEILKQYYRLMAQDTWNAISVAKMEKNISQTRGAIFYFNKNKSDLFVNMTDG